MSVVAITGASGFLGNAIVRKLSENGVQIKALENRSPVYRHDNITVIKGDLNNQNALETLCEGTDAVIHCAALVAAARRQSFYDVNTHATKLLIEAVKLKTPASRILFISSLAARHPHLSPYADSKNKAEALFHAESDLKFDIFRPTAIYGEGEKEILPLLKLIKMNIGIMPAGPKAILSTLHVSDLTDAVLKWTASNISSQQTYEVVDDKDKGYEWVEIIEILAKLMDKPQIRMITPPRFLLKSIGASCSLAGRITNNSMFTSSGKVDELLHPDWSANNQQIKAYLTWHPRISFGDGAKSMLDYYKRSGLL